ncbi:MAG: LysM peptidoglycan-binding domain-containing protein, partial [Deltaproteobacteria bacterium]
MRAGLGGRLVRRSSGDGRPLEDSMAQLTQAPSAQTTSTSPTTGAAARGATAGLTGQARGMSFADGEALLNPGRERYTVRPGDTLGVIAKRTLGNAGRWQEIHQLNLETIGPNPDRIRPGQVLVLPADAQVAAPASAPQAPAVGPTSAPKPGA